MKRRSFLSLIGLSAPAGATTFRRWNHETEEWENMKPFNVDDKQYGKVDIKFNVPLSKDKSGPMAGWGTKVFIDGKEVPQVRSFRLCADCNDVVRLELEILPSEINIDNGGGEFLIDKKYVDLEREAIDVTNLDSSGGYREYTCNTHNGLCRWRRRSEGDDKVVVEEFKNGSWKVLGHVDRL